MKVIATRTYFDSVNSIVEIFMLTGKTRCDNCQTQFDECLEECSKCHTKSRRFAELNINDKMTWTETRRQIGLFLLGWIGLQIISIIYVVINYAIEVFSHGLSYEEATDVISNPLNSMLNNSVSYTLLLVGMLIIIWPQIRKILKSYASGQNILFGFLLGFALIGASAVYGLIVSSFYSTSGNANQTTLTSLITQYPVPTIIILGIIGPLVEEFTYRVGLFNFLSRSKRWIAYLATVLIFAFIHFSFFSLLTYSMTPNAENYDVIINELVNIPQYLIAGLILCFAYEKFGFAGSTIAHILNNLISVISVLIIPLVQLK